MSSQLTETNSEKPFKVHVWVCGTYSGFYDFATEAEAIEDYNQNRKPYEILGCYYRIETPNPDKITALMLKRLSLSQPAVPV